jgi:hypothetical protein
VIKRPTPKRRRGPAHWLRNKRLRCNCTGYWFPHRAGGGACVYGPRAAYYAALRVTRDQLEAFAEWAFDTRGKTYHDPAAEPPF